MLTIAAYRTASADRMGMAHRPHLRVCAGRPSRPPATSRQNKQSPRNPLATAIIALWARDLLSAGPCQPQPNRPEVTIGDDNRGAWVGPVHARCGPRRDPVAGLDASTTAIEHSDEMGDGSHRAAGHLGGATLADSVTPSISTLVTRGVERARCASRRSPAQRQTRCCCRGQRSQPLVRE